MSSTVNTNDKLFLSSWDGGSEIAANCPIRHNFVVDVTNIKGFQGANIAQNPRKLPTSKLRLIACLLLMLFSECVPDWIRLINWSVIVLD